MPPPAAVNAAFAPLLPPLVLQTVAEQTVTAIVSAVPKYLTEGCQRAQREVLCSSLFLKPVESDALLSVMGLPLYVPSYPHHNLCERYMQECSVLVENAPILALNCSMLLPGDVHMYPSAPQVSLLSLFFSLSGSNIIMFLYDIPLITIAVVVDQTVAQIPLGAYSIPVVTAPNDLSQSNASMVQYDVQCPYALTVPEDPSLSGISWIAGALLFIVCVVRFKASDFSHALWWIVTQAQAAL